MGSIIFIFGMVLGNFLAKESNSFKVGECVRELGSKDVGVVTSQNSELIEVKFRYLMTYSKEEQRHYLVKVNCEDGHE